MTDQKLITATPIDRAIALLDPTRIGDRIDDSKGYIDLLGETPLLSPGLGQDMMTSWFYPRIYQWWRPLATRFALARLDHDRAAERARARVMLDLRRGQTVLDLACGPGNFTGWFGGIVGPGGLAVGVDASETMLAQAIRDNAEGPVAYLRADAQRLPVRDSSVDAVCCFAALFLMAEPLRALDEITRVLVPGGRVAIMTSCASRLLALRALERAVARTGGMHIFDRAAITGALRERGFTDVGQQVAGVVQFISGRKAL